MKKILVLEDNAVTLAHLVSLLREMEIKTDIYPCTNVKDAYQCAMEKEIDVFIIDIILDASRPGDSSGLLFVDNIRQMERYTFTPVIFVTALEDAKLFTYENLHCYSFIEKPFDSGKLKKLVKQCLNFPEIKQKKKILYFRKDGIILAVDRDEIVYIECRNHIMDIHTKQGECLSLPYVTIKRIMADIDSEDFIQCSRSIVVRKSYIHSIDFTNKIIQIKDREKTVEIGLRFESKLREMFK